MTYYEKLDKVGLLVRGGWIVSWKNNQTRIKNKQQYKKIQIHVKKHIVKLTSYLPDNYGLSYRLKILKLNLIEKDMRCPVCNNWRKNTNDFRQKGSLKYFTLTCGILDKDHKKYSIDQSIEKGQKTCLQKYGKLCVLQLNEVKNKIKDTCLIRYGTEFACQAEEVKVLIKKGCQNTFGIDSANKSHYNIENYNKLSKEYIEDNFLTNEGFVLVDKFMAFINCSRSMPYRFCRRFGVNFMLRTPSGIGVDSENPAILYYFQDIITGWYKLGISSKKINERFNKSIMKEIKVIKIWEFKKGGNAYEVEQALHYMFKKDNIFNNRFKNNGATEFFNKDILNLNT